MVDVACFQNVRHHRHLGCEIENAAGRHYAVYTVCVGTHSEPRRRLFRYDCIKFLELTVLCVARLMWC
jgi:hypothetical protein